MEVLAVQPAIPAIPASDGDGRWCILRTSGSQTIRLATSLQAAGFSAWTPIEMLSRRGPRSRATAVVRAAMAPTYVFVAEHHLEAMRRMEREPGHGHPQFSIFRYYGETVFVRHAVLHPLRQRQQDSYRASLPVVKQVLRKERGDAYSQGDKVKLKQGPLQGLECTVDISDGLTTTLIVTIFGREAGVKVKTSQMRADGIDTITSAA